MLLSPRERRERLAASVPEWTIPTIAHLLMRTRAAHGDRPYIITDEREYTYAQVDEWSRRLASGLIAAGLKRGEHVALEMANYPEFIALKLAIVRAGAVCVPINYLLKANELSYVLEQSNANFFITMDEFRDYDYLAALDGIAPCWRDGTDQPVLNKLRTVIVRFSDGRPSKGLRDLDWLAGRSNPESDRELADREAAAKALDLCDILYTSGTTGRPKGVMVTHDMILRAAYASAYNCAHQDGWRIQYALPMYHVFGYVECMVASMFVGGAVIPYVKFDALQMIEGAERHRASEMVCVPMMTLPILDIVRERGFDASHFITMFNSGGVNPPTIWADIKELMRPKEILTGYGMTETTASTTCTLPEDGDDRLLGSNGRIKLAGIAGDPAIGGATAIYKAIDPVTGDDLPYGEPGELVVRGPIVTKGYYNKPEETAAAFTADGWLRTGDIGIIRADGYLSLTGRIKEAYRCGGEMVMPREVEALYDNHPDIELALIIGVPDAKMGEVGCLCVVPKPDAQPDPQALIALAMQNLARFKVPKFVLFMSAEEIPLTPSMRPQKVLLQKTVIAKIKEREEAAA